MAVIAFELHALGGLGQRHRRLAVGERIQRRIRQGGRLRLAPGLIGGNELLSRPQSIAEEPCVRLLLRLGAGRKCGVPHLRGQTDHREIIFAAEPQHAGFLRR
ncbi:hypothetical protein ABIG07_002882 [Bradyrhizobium ottawaense]|uniref:Uncharacterized protein n=1 Tax=Bradyrhizobium ottawaense TaxID=931866 RepID=A0ABV4FST8_9BRAD